MISKLNYNIDWSEHFVLDETSPSGLRWKYIPSERSVSIAGYTSYRRKGQRHSWRVQVSKGSSYYIHRILCVMWYGFLDSSMVVDHLDGDPFNNNKSNLVVKTPQENMQNKRQYKRNTSGETGITKIDTKDGYSYFVARWYNKEGQRLNKLFSIFKLGEHLAFENAVEYRRNMLKELNIDGAAYTERHGT